MKAVEKIKPLVLLDFLLELARGKEIRKKRERGEMEREKKMHTNTLERGGDCYLFVEGKSRYTNKATLEFVLKLRKWFLPQLHNSLSWNEDVKTGAGD